MYNTNIKIHNSKFNQSEDANKTYKKYNNLNILPMKELSKLVNQDNVTYKTDNSIPITPSKFDMIKSPFKINREVETIVNNIKNNSVSPSKFTAVSQSSKFTPVSQSSKFTPVSQPSPSKFAPVSQPSPSKFAPVSQSSPSKFAPVSQSSPSKFASVSQPSPSKFASVSQPSKFIGVSSPSKFVAVSSPSKFTSVSQPSPSKFTSVSQSSSSKFTSVSQPSSPKFTSVSQPSSSKFNQLSSSLSPSSLLSSPSRFAAVPIPSSSMFIKSSFSSNNNFNKESSSTPISPFTFNNVRNIPEINAFKPTLETIRDTSPISRSNYRSNSPIRSNYRSNSPIRSNNSSRSNSPIRSNNSSRSNSPIRSDNSSRINSPIRNNNSNRSSILNFLEPLDIPLKSKKSAYMKTLSEEEQKEHEYQEYSNKIIKLPDIDTIIPKVPLEEPDFIITESTVAVAFNPLQSGLTLKDNFDINRLSKGKTSGSGTDKSYSLIECKAFIKERGINLPNKANKEQCVDILKEYYDKYAK